MRRVDPVFMGQHRHHRLHAIQQRKRREPTREQRQYRAHKHRGAFFDKHIIEFSDTIIQRRRPDFVGERGDSSFHGGPQKARKAERQWQKNIGG